MKIAVACPYAWDAPGGVQVHVRQLSHHLRRLGHDVLVLAPASDGPSGEAASARGLRVVGKPLRVRFNGSIVPICPDPRSRGRVADALSEFRPDVVHAHEPFAPSTAMFAVLASPAPVVATFHAYTARTLARDAFAPLLRRVWKRLSVRLAVSAATSALVSRRFSGRIRVVPNGVDVDLFSDATPAPLPPGHRLLFVSRLEPRKGFRIAVQAFRLLSLALPEALLVVAGDGPERKAVEALPPQVRGRVLMVGTVPHERLPAYHAAAHAFVAPATGGESFGIVLLEAMAAGVPVVATGIPGYSEVVRHGTDGLLVRPNHPVELAGALRRVLTDPALAGRLSAAGRARAEGYRWEVVASRIEEAYREAIAGGAR